MTFTEYARWVGPTLFPWLDPSVLQRVLSRAFDFEVQLVELEANRFVLELFHGPTLAFKDVGARFLAAIIDEVSEAGRTRVVLVATSGDTGGAVANAFLGMEDTHVVALFPEDGISERQRRQMSVPGGNVHAVAVRGTFDDCQRIAKEAFADLELRDGFGLTSANSINIGRLLPQALYYGYAAHLIGVSAPGARPPRFIVPCGNLGNLCAGLLAWKAGMPSSGFVAATNSNRALVRFMEDGEPPEESSHRTLSTAMDVAQPSNLERIRWMFDDVRALRRVVSAVAISDEETGRCMNEVYRRHGYILDPHSAVAFEASLRHRSSDSAPHVVVATAHPAKFPDIVESMTDMQPQTPSALQKILAGPERVYRMDPSVPGLTLLLHEVVR